MSIRPALVRHDREARRRAVEHEMENDKTVSIRYALRWVLGLTLLLAFLLSFYRLPLPLMD